MSRIFLSASLGFAIGGANFIVLFWLAKKLVLGAARKWRFGVLIGLKFLVLIFILWAIIKWLPINVVALLAGLTISLILAIFYARV